MKNEIKRHLISFAITFLAVFAIMIFPALYVGNWEAGAIVAAAIAAARSALKLAYEVALLPLFNWLLDWAKNYARDDN